MRVLDNVALALACLVAALAAAAESTASADDVPSHPVFGIDLAMFHSLPIERRWSSTARPYGGLYVSLPGERVCATLAAGSAYDRPDSAWSASGTFALSPVCDWFVSPSAFVSAGWERARFPNTFDDPFVGAGVALSLEVLSFELSPSLGAYRPIDGVDWSLVAAFGLSIALF